MRGFLGSCPLCGTSAGFLRCFFGSHIWARWRCKGCGALIGWSRKGRFVLAAFLVVAMLVPFGFVAFSSIRPTRTLLFAMLAPAMGIGIVLGTRTRVIAAKATLCPNCGYDAGDLLVCPECGTDQPARPPSPQ